MIIINFLLAIPCHHVLPRTIPPQKSPQGDTLNIQSPCTFGRFHNRLPLSP